MKHLFAFIALLAAASAQSATLQINVSNFVNAATVRKLALEPTSDVAVGGGGFAAGPKMTYTPANGQVMVSNIFPCGYWLTFEGLSTKIGLLTYETNGVINAASVVTVGTNMVSTGTVAYSMEQSDARYASAASVSNIVSSGITNGQESVYLYEPALIWRDANTNQFYTQSGDFIGSSEASGEWLRVNSAGATITADLGATTNNLFAWVSSEAYEPTNIVVDASGVIQTAGVRWPDGYSGLLTNTQTNATWLTVDAFTITHSGTGWTVVQSVVSRGPLGVVTNKPALTIQ